MSEYENDKEEVIENFLKVEKELKRGEPLGLIQTAQIEFCLSNYIQGNCKLCSSFFSDYSQRINSHSVIKCPNFSKKGTARENLANMLFIGISKIEEEKRKKFFFYFFINVLLEDIGIKKRHLFYKLNIVEKVLKDKKSFTYYNFEEYYDERVDWKFLLLKILGL